MRQDLRKKILQKGISNRVNIIENMANTILNEDMCINEVDSLKLLPFNLNGKYELKYLLIYQI